MSYATFDAPETPFLRLGYGTVFTKQDGEIESEAVPPTRRELIKESPLGVDEGLAMKDVVTPASAPTLLTEPTDHTQQQNKTGKMVTFHSDLVTGCVRGNADEVDLESYPNSPRKLKQGITTDTQCCDDTNNDKCQFVRTSYYQNPAEYVQSNNNQPAQEIVTTRVCVELGVITNSTDKGELVEAPTIVLCSVDVEPCPGKVVELNEVTVTPVGDNGNPSITDHECMNNKDNASTSAAIGVLAENDIVIHKKVDVPLVNSSDSGDVLEKISHDLDYLLNRTPQDSNGNSSDSLSYQREPLLNIKEEDELGNTITTSGLIAKTSL